MQNDIDWHLLPFDALSTKQLYDILHLRNQVFGVEQNDVYLDVDFKDQEAQHLLGFIEQQLVAYCRIFPPSQEDEHAKIGRVVVSPHYRQYGFGRLLMSKALSVVDVEMNAQSVFISAQFHLLDFYKSFGFNLQGESYMDGSIEHIDMVRFCN